MAPQRGEAIMPVCEGLPSGPCPHHRNDKTVGIGKGDLMLCQSCDTERRRLFDDNKKLNESKSNAVKPAANDVDDTSRKLKSTRSASARAMLTSSSTEQSGGTNVTVLPAATESSASSSASLASSASVIVNDETAASSLLFPDRPTKESTRTEVKVIINELLTYAMFYRDKSTGADLHKMIVSFYLPSEISESKTLFINEFSTYLTDCPFKTARRQSNTRSAHDAEVEDILGMLTLVDNLNLLNSVIFTAAALDRLPQYGPNEINICAIVDKQLQLDKQLSSLSSTFEETLGHNRVEIGEAIDDKFKVISDRLQAQLNEFSSKCMSAVESLNSQAVTERHVSENHVDRSMNVVITGIEENRDVTVWREVVMRALNHAAGTQIDVVDAFRLGRFTSGRTRPILVKLNSVWNRRLIIAGARKLRDTTDLSRVFVTADEPPDVRRRNTLQRLKHRAERAGKNVQVSQEGVLTIDGVDTFCLQRGFIASQSSDIPNHYGGQH